MQKNLENHQVLQNYAKESRCNLRIPKYINECQRISNNRTQKKTSIFKPIPAYSRLVLSIPALPFLCDSLIS